MNDAMITQPLNTKLLLTRRPQQLKFKPKCFNINFAVLQPLNSRFCNIYFGSLQANQVQRKMGENREKIVFVISRKKKENCDIDLLYRIIETDLKKQCLFKLSHNKNVSANIPRVLQNFKLILIFHVIHCVTKILTIKNFLIQIYSFQVILLTGACRKSQI